MSAISDALSAARLATQAAMEERHGGSVTIGSTSYAAGISLRVADASMEDGGFAPVGVLTATILKTSLTSLPARGTVIVCEGRSYLIDLDRCGGLKTTDKAWVIRANEAT